MKRNIKSRFMRSSFSHSADINAKLSESNSSTSELKMSTIEFKKSTLEIETDLWDKLSMSSSTSKQLQNDIVDLFRSQQKSLTSANRKTQYMFSSFNALMLNSHANAISSHLLEKVLREQFRDSDLSKHMIYQIDRQVIEHNRTIKTSPYSTQ